MGDLGMNGSDLRYRIAFPASAMLTCRLGALRDGRRQESTVQSGATTTKGLTMSKFLLALSLSAAMTLAACGAEQPAATSDSDPMPADDSQSAAMAAASKGFHYSPWPGMVIVETPFHVRSDRIYTTKNGADRRRTTLELLEGEAAKVIGSIGDTLVSGGFSAMNIPDKGDGIQRLAYRRNGYGRINLSAKSDVGDKPANPRATGLITFDWPLSGSEPPEAGALERRQ
jgi:hypothetical protein